MVSGILLLDKPPGLSSNAALQRVRALLGRVKAGHVGSLDPLATGMLPICLGEATKVAGEIAAGRKRYRFTVTLGVATATGDAEGELTGRAPVPPLERAALESALAGFLGRQAQLPPMYSALKRAGQPLYRLARAGVTVERSPRAIELTELRLVAFGERHLELETLCSKGTYVRVLAEDIATTLGTLGHVTALRRLAVEPFDGEPMQTLDSVAALCARGEWPALLPADRALGHLPAVHLPSAEVERLRHGQRVHAPLPAGAQRLRLYDESGSFLGIGEAQAAATVQPRRLLNPAEPPPVTGRAR
jgi:tRNA pseudouridine55 synthase